MNVLIPALEVISQTLSKGVSTEFFINED